MEVVGSAASVIAVIDLSAKVATTCVQYLRNVKNAKADIERFKREVDSVTNLLRHVKELLQGVGKTSLSTSIELENALADCKIQLQQVNTAIYPGKGRKVMSKFGARALKWPLETKEVEKAISSLERCKGTISLALQVDQVVLQGSFFFKRGEDDRNQASKFFTTIAHQLTIQIPTITPFVREAIDVDPHISTKNLKEQFTKIILQPLSKIPSVAPESRKRVILVVDALDECEREADIGTILGLLSQFSNVASVCLRVFLTSRPDLPIRLGFQEMPQATYKDLALHDISEETIKHDIHEFLQSEFTKMRLRHSLNIDWPSQVDINALVDMASPLFIFAATACRFIGEQRLGPPEDRLAIILKHHSQRQASKFDQASEFDATYLPILEQLFVGLNQVKKEELVTKFQRIVGTIVVLVSPLSVEALASLLGIQKSEVTCILDFLHSVLSIPTSQAHPVRLLHLSFRDFLLDERKKEKSLFWVDEKKTHERIANECLQLMSKPDCLNKDICGRRNPGTLRSQIAPQIIDSSLQAELKYACSYWVYHLEHSSGRLEDNGQVHIFLQQHLLHWLEAMSILERTSESITMILSLLALCEADRCPKLHAFLDDARRFTLYNRSLIEQAPLQLYCSALAFVPQNSIVRRKFESDIPPWIQMKPKVQVNWDAARQTLEGHSAGVKSVAFSPDGKMVASASDDNTVRLWDAATGEARQTLEGHSAGVSLVAFSPDGKMVASASDDNTVRLWDAATGAARQTLEGHSKWVRSVAFSPDGKMVASASDDNTVRFWDAATGAAHQTLQLGTSELLSFSSSGQCLRTDCGSFRISPSSTSLNSVVDSWISMSVDNEWIMEDDNCILWLPLDYRPACLAVFGPMLVLGHVSGTVSFLKFAQGSKAVD